MNGSVSVGKPSAEIKVYLLHKVNGGMGLSIVATKGIGQDQLGIYVKTVVPGGAADRVGIKISFHLLTCYFLRTTFQ